MYRHTMSKQSKVIYRQADIVYSMHPALSILSIAARASRSRRLATSSSKAASELERNVDVPETAVWVVSPPPDVGVTARS